MHKNESCPHAAFYWGFVCTHECFGLRIEFQMSESCVLVLQGRFKEEEKKTTCIVVLQCLSRPSL